MLPKTGRKGNRTNAGLWLIFGLVAATRMTSAVDPIRCRLAWFATVGIALSMSVQNAPAQSDPAPRPKPCAAVEHHQFDFWVGTWNVFAPSGKKVGENRIEVIADGCALLEQWTGNGNVTGKSLNIYDTSDSRWHQTWVDNGGTLLMLAGGLV